VVAAETILELERLARAAGSGTVGTVGEIEVSPGLINAIPGRTRISLDVRGPEDDLVHQVIEDIDRFAQRAAADRQVSASYSQRQTVAATPLDGRLVAALEAAAEETAEPFMTMVSGAAHDTMCVADRVPSAMVFVPCRDGLSHTPEEDADPDDAALGVQVMLGAIHALASQRTAA
jgi:acetylornithine deacetylase/succinyl-diaminopimelate desuccinylase-like protein